MPRIGTDLLCLSLLHDTAAVHDTNPVADPAYHVYIMGNEQTGEADLSLDPEDQFQYLFPGGRIQ